MFRVAAPGSYDVEKVDKTILQSSIAYSFGQKHKDPKPDDVPGKCLLEYFVVLSSLLCLPLKIPDRKLKLSILHFYFQAECLNSRIQRKIFFYLLLSWEGKEKPLFLSFGHFTHSHILRLHSASPYLYYLSFCVTAPGSYDVEKVDKNVLQSSPAYSFGMKHKDQKPDDTPGNFLFLTHILILLNVTFQTRINVKFKTGFNLDLYNASYAFSCMKIFLV